MSCENIIWIIVKGVVNTKYDLRILTIVIIYLMECIMRLGSHFSSKLHMFILAICGACFAVFLIGCTNELTSGDTPENARSDRQSIQYINPTAYDSVGLFHNQVMQYISDIYGFTESLTQTQGVGGIVQWFTNHSSSDGVDNYDSVSNHSQVVAVISGLDSLENISRTACCVS